MRRGLRRPAGPGLPREQRPRRWHAATLRATPDGALRAAFLNIGDPAVLCLVGVLETARPPALGRVVTMLGKLRAVAALEPLVRRLTDPDPAVRSRLVTAIIPGAAFTCTASMFIDPTGRFLFQNTCVLSEGINPRGPQHGFAVWSIDGSTGALTRALGGVPLHYGAPFGSFVFDPEGKFAYMIGEGALLAYTIDPDTGGLADIPGSPYPAGYDRDKEPFYSSGVHPGGKCIDLAGDSRISILAIDAVSAALTEIEGSPIASGLFPMALSVDPLARFVFAASRDQRALFVYSIDPVTGSLSQAAGSPYPLPGLKSGLAAGILLLFSLVSAAGERAGRQSPGQTDMSESAARKRLVESVAAVVETNYVLPSVAVKVAAALRERLRSGAYEDIATAERLTRALTEDMRSVSRDTHLGVVENRRLPPGATSAAVPGSASSPAAKTIPLRNFGFQQARRMPGNIGCLATAELVELESEGESAAWKTALAALRFVSHAQALMPQ